LSWKRDKDKRGVGRTGGGETAERQKKVAGKNDQKKHMRQIKGSANQVWKIISNPLGGERN